MYGLQPCPLPFAGVSLVIKGVSFPHEGNARKREWARLQSIHGTGGFREGVDEGKEDRLQEGFNVGFAEGSERGLAFGNVVGIVSSLDLMFGEREELCPKELRESISQLSEYLSDRSTNRTKSLNAGNFAQAEKEAEDAFAAVSKFIQEQLDRSASDAVPDTYKQLVLSIVHSLSLPVSKESLLHSVFFDVFPKLLPFAGVTGVDEILRAIAVHCNAKEVFLLVTETLDSHKQ
eukprot:TRINITY_DN7196_c0_g1_i1.p1 TRINITY_DN7196_c0_g1~~TRINITY_DN7196_c0_g1_i1.p1  ORF type:complete len:233 (+),score=35.97 TRINITY_DN7196_c0_g1_i1:261-959(+)